MLYADCKLWLPDNLLDRGDRMTMGASVEGRVPFLDHELVEYAFSLPADMKVRGFTRKYVIKQIARKYLPAGIVDRPKVGFRLPLTQWFRGRLRDMCYDRICAGSGFAAQVLNRIELQKLLDDHCAGARTTGCRSGRCSACRSGAIYSAIGRSSAARTRFATTVGSGA